MTDQATTTIVPTADGRIVVKRAARPRVLRSHWRRYHATVCNCFIHHHWSPGFPVPVSVTRWIALRPIPLLRRDRLVLVDRHDPWCYRNPAGRRYRGVAAGLPATGGAG